MKITYIVEDSNNNIIEYCRTLKAAKDILQRYDGHRIIKIRGQYFGEGYHVYQLVWDGKKYHRFQL